MEEQVRQNRVEITLNGPYVVTGKLSLRQGVMVPDEEGIPQYWRAGDQISTDETYYLCRCGQSKNKPFCDDSHLNAEFDGTETALKIPYQDTAVIFSGPDIEFADGKVFCASGRFCMRAGGIRLLVEEPESPDSKKIAIEEGFDCPSGNLVMIDKQTGEMFEPNLEPGIVIAEDPGKKVGGPLWVRGGIEVISADGEKYEVRNRVALCRCGQSRNKPFCDGSHIRVGFQSQNPE